MLCHSGRKLPRAGTRGESRGAWMKWKCKTGEKDVLPICAIKDRLFASICSNFIKNGIPLSKISNIIDNRALWNHIVKVVLRSQTDELGFVGKEEEMDTLGRVVKTLEEIDCRGEEMHLADREWSDKCIIKRPDETLEWREKITSN
jgi:hypothetical protein